MVNLETLRDLQEKVTKGEPALIGGALGEAALEIERLRLELAQAKLAEDAAANLEAEILRLRAYEHIEGQHGETGRIWAGPRYKMPAGFFEVSNESGDPGPRTALAPGDSRE
jgi:hypothetical protein